MRGLVGEILSRFEKVGLKIVGLKMLRPDEAHYHHHYETIGTVISRRGEQVYRSNADFMQQGPVIAGVLEGIEAVELVRKMVGPTEPKSAMPGTIRGDYAHMSYTHGDKHQVAIANLMHASSNTEEAAKEIAHWFKPDEMFEYTNVHERFTQPRK